MKSKHILYLTIAFLVIAFLLILLFVPKFSVNLIQLQCPECDRDSAIRIALQLGRLDIIALAVAFLGIGVGFFVIFSFFAIKEDAKKVAEDLCSVRFANIQKDMEEQIKAQVKAAIDRKVSAIDYRLGATDLPSVEDIDVTNRKEADKDE